MVNPIFDFKPLGDNHPFHIGQPVWVKGDPETCWVPVGFVRAMWSEWIALCVPETNLTSEPHDIPCSWLSDKLPGEPEWIGERYTAKIINLSDYRRTK